MISYTETDDKTSKGLKMVNFIFLCMYNSISSFTPVEFNEKLKLC